MAENNIPSQDTRSEACVIWGSKGHALVIRDIIDSYGQVIIAMFDNNVVPSAIPNVRVFYGQNGFIEWDSAHRPKSRVSGYVAIGGARGHDRVTFLEFFKRNGILTPNLIHRTANVSPSAILEQGVQVLAQANVAAGSRIGKGGIINNCASVDHECSLADGVHLGPGAVLCGCVSVSRNVFIGANAVVLPRITVHENSIVGAGAVVTKDVPPNQVVAGNPARILEKTNYLP
jgi:sugar O-acyltransferase (sialic acid O-acetyltransferase NeuD family)